ncbi:hypothetical protein RSOLAG22IIIB_05950 [Rhizoctonia solani]|uniref:DUF6535 domain-containing protein n=1 Tax=Rhizoctonia solani TaxID=456999 RepID=A0A0K6GAB5_9AGAM|nr:hypothetical protein RSOLAG22IIIB_05950 [Rhizoctonia solani]
MRSTTDRITIMDPPQEFDGEGKELGPDAQVWKTYVREADRVDEELVDGWNKSMDVNLNRIITIVQAALFSAISTAFVIESYKNLKEDPADVSAQTLLVISQTLSSLANASQPATSMPVSAEEAAPFRASASTICVNVLWFLSLSLSVAITLVSMLAKEWCLEFMSGRAGPPGAQARRRQQRWDGLESWRMKEVLTVLPSLIHLSLLLFAIGLCVFLWNVHYGVAIPVVIVTTLAAGAYFACTVLPFIDNYCPYGTVLSRLYKQFSGEYTQSVRDTGIQDEITSRALHWMIVNCETPRSVDVALQSLAGAEKGLPPTMLEKCDAWTLIRQRAESINPTEGEVDSVRSLYKRALDCHFNMRIPHDISAFVHLDYQRLVPLVLGLQACINSVIYKVLEQLHPSDHHRSILHQCTLIGPRLLRFEFYLRLIDESTLWGSGLGEYDYDMHAERSEALAENIIQLLAQHMTGQVETDPGARCALSTSLLLLLSFKITNDPPAAMRYIQRLIRVYQLQASNGSEYTPITMHHDGAIDQLNQATFALLIGAVAVANTKCFVKESPCFSNSFSETGTLEESLRRIEKVVELGWQCLTSAVYPGFLFNVSHYSIHGMLHLLARAETYHLSAEDCTFISDFLGGNKMQSGSSIKEDECCLAYHVEEITSALNTTPSLDLDTLPAPLLTCLKGLPNIVYGGEYLQPTPETYVLTVKAICWEFKSGVRARYVSLIRLFPFPKVSQRLIDILSTNGVFHQLLPLLNSENLFEQAFAVAQIWLLFHMLLQAPDCRSDTLHKLEEMLFEYPGLGHDPNNQETIIEGLESRLLSIADRNEHNGFFNRTEYAHEWLEEVPQKLRGINSFVDLEADAPDPCHHQNVVISNLEPADSGQPTTSLQVSTGLVL